MQCHKRVCHCRVDATVNTTVSTVKTRTIVVRYFSFFQIIFSLSFIVSIMCTGRVCMCQIGRMHFIDTTMRWSYRRLSGWIEYGRNGLWMYCLIRYDFIHMCLSSMSRQISLRTYIDDGNVRRASRCNMRRLGSAL